jgi:hypothetical protein
MANYKYKILEQSKIKSYAFTGFFVALVLPVITWILEIAAWKMSVSFQGLIFIHIKSPSLWIIDIAPFIIGYGLFYLLKRKSSEQLVFIQEIRQQKERMDITARFAKEIGDTGR